MLELIKEIEAAGGMWLVRGVQPAEERPGKYLANIYPANEELTLENRNICYADNPEAALSGAFSLFLGGPNA